MAPPKPTPAIPSAGVFSAVSGGTINAPADIIYRAIVDTATWAEWCSFVPNVQVTSQPSGTNPASATMVKGTKMTFTVQMNPTFKTKSAEEVTALAAEPMAHDPPGTTYNIQWEGRSIPKMLLHAERMNEITKTEFPNICEYKTWETFAGPTAYPTRWKVESDLDARFDNWFKDLKSYCEKIASDERAERDSDKSSREGST